MENEEHVKRHKDPEYCLPRGPKNELEEMCFTCPLPVCRVDTAQCPIVITKLARTGRTSRVDEDGTLWLVLKN